MTHLEMRNFELHYDPEDTELSAQERLLFNNNYNSNHHNHNGNGHPPNGTQHYNSNTMSGSGGEEENQYQVPYGHLQHHHYLQHQQQLQQQLQNHPELSYSGSSAGDHSSTFRSVTPQMNGHVQTHLHYNPHHHSPYPPSSPYPGNHHPHHNPNLHDKYSVAYPLRNEHGMRATGSGIVYRPRRKLWWVAAMLALFLLLIAGAVVIALYFTVLRKDMNAPQTLDGTDKASEVGTGVGVDAETRPSDTDIPTRQPPYIYPDVDIDTPRNPFLNQVQKFEAFWHPGDSRLFAATFTNGTTIRAFGPKKSNGEVRSLYSLSLTTEGRSVSSVRFLGQNNLASVILPSGVIVNYDWTAKDTHMEIKVFEPYVAGKQGPISHLALVEVGISAYLFRQVPKIMHELPNQQTLTGGRPGSTKCFARFPVKVTKCGGFSYYGAFVQGEITGLNKPIVMAALPWPAETDSCYSHTSNMASNYYLPLPGYVDEDNAKKIKDAYTASSARMFSQLCQVINDQAYDDREALCLGIADRVEKKLNRPAIHSIIYSSCSAILNSLNTACVAITSISALDQKPSLSEKGLLSSFERRLSDSFPPGLPDQVKLKAHAFCPSSVRLSSYETTVDIHTIQGNVVQDVIHINCPDYPEVTKVDLDHLLTSSGVQSSNSHFDLVKHKMRVCSLCAFEKSVSAEIIKDQMMCNNTCSNTSVEQVPDIYTEEKIKFMEQDSVYCHDFLTTVDNYVAPPIGHQCRANCMSHIDVRLKIWDTKSNTMYYDQKMECLELRGHFCRMSFGR